MTRSLITKFSGRTVKSNMYLISYVYFSDCVSHCPLPVTGWRSPGSGWDRCTEDWGRVPAAVVQRRQQRSHARLRRGTHLGLVKSFRMQEIVVEKVWLFFDNEVNVSVGIRADLSGKYLLNVSSSREPQRCICWCWLQRYPPLPLLGCCPEGPGPHWVPGWFRGEIGTMTPV